MRPVLEEHGVKLVAISPDTPEEVAAFIAQNALGVKILSDANLCVTDCYNLRVTKTLALAAGRSKVRDLAIPTTVLVDEQGRVRWIDQARDFRIRSDERRVLDAVPANTRPLPYPSHTSPEPCACPPIDSPHLADTT